MVRKWGLVVAVAFLVQGTSQDAFARAPERLPFAVRSKNLTLTVYRPSTAARGTIIIGQRRRGVGRSRRPNV